MITTAKIKEYNKVEDELFEDEYEMYSNIFHDLKVKEFYKLNETDYVPVEYLENAKTESIELAEILEEIASSSELLEMKKDIDKLNTEEGVKEIIEEYDIIIFPSYILDLN